MLVPDLKEKMMKHIFLLVTALFSFSSCGASPLLNHENANDKKNIKIQVADEKCPLYFPNSDLCAKIEWIVRPSGDGENSFLIKFWDKETGNSAGPYKDPEHDLIVQLWMPSMGHGSSPVTVTEKDIGIYKAARVFFIMPGDWDIRVKLQDGDAVVEQAMQKVKI